ncbi:MAG: hypothetical protein ABIR96_08320 [Bdellovibrionota bacterium]
MNFKAFGLGLSLVLASQAFAASESCFEFTLVPVGVDGVADHPAIVTGRRQNEEGEVVAYTQEIVPLNEEAQDTLAGLHTGQTVCLKGTRGYISPTKYFAYSVRRQ